MDITQEYIFETLGNLAAARITLLDRKLALETTKANVKIYRWHRELDLIEQRGGEKALGSNEAARERTIELILAEDPNWIEFQKLLIERERSVVLADIEVERLRNLIRLVPELAEVR